MARKSAFLNPSRATMATQLALGEIPHERSALRRRVREHVSGTREPGTDTADQLLTCVPVRHRAPERYDATGDARLPNISEHRRSRPRSAGRGRRGCAIPDVSLRPSRRDHDNRWRQPARIYAVARLARGAAGNACARMMDTVDHKGGETQHALEGSPNRPRDRFNSPAGIPKNLDTGWRKSIVVLQRCSG